MANAVKWTGGTSRTTGISSQSVSAGANYLGSEIDNSTNKDRYMACQLRMYDATNSPTAGDTVELYVLKSLDGTQYEDGASTDPARGMDAVFIARAATDQYQTVVDIPIPPFAFKILLKSELDVQMDLTLTAYTYNEEIQ